jgi:hypothetical protein
MSHTEPLAAGMSCTQCHVFTEVSLAEAKSGRMQTCLFCHDGSGAAKNDCNTCHRKSPTAYATHRADPANAQDLVTTSAQNYCYDCHKTKSCDSCHGLRIPHSADFQDTDNEATMGVHARAAIRLGSAMCEKCHNTKSASGAVPCTNCHDAQTYTR